jgi:hypothetical protein
MVSGTIKESPLRFFHGCRKRRQKDFSTPTWDEPRSQGDGLTNCHVYSISHCFHFFILRLGGISEMSLKGYSVSELYDLKWSPHYDDTVYRESLNSTWVKGPETSRLIPRTARSRDVIPVQSTFLRIVQSCAGAPWAGPAYAKKFRGQFCSLFLTILRLGR